MATETPQIMCPHCGQNFELDAAFAENFEKEKREAVKKAIATTKKKADEDLEELEEKFAQERDELTKKIEKETQEASEKKYQLELAAKDEEMKRVQKRLEELEKSTRQGSMELQGEALEVHVKSILKECFPIDSIDDVKKGQSGADLIHTIINPHGQRCGSIIWETKNTKNWNKSWTSKIKEDASRANAQLSVIVSMALPDGIRTFDLLDGVWICSVEAAPALARVLREQLLQITNLQRAMDGQGDKMQTVYLYLTSTDFKDRVGRMVDTWQSLRGQIDSEERAMKKQWKERRKQLDVMIDVTTDMYTDISSIIGADMPQVEGLSLEALPAGSEA